MPSRTPSLLTAGFQCVHQWFEYRANQTPDAIAVVFEDRELTYRELNERANQLAHFLRHMGVAPETLVGLCLEQSPDLVVGILGILKAGGAYVPLDANHPRRRLEFMLDDAQVEIVVTQQRLLNRLPATGCRIVCLHRDDAGLVKTTRSNPTVNTAADNLAYVLFTSGSTGQPKGVAMPHRPLVNLLAWHQMHSRLKRPARTMQFAPAWFDVSFQDIVETLCSGGTVYFVTDRMRLDPVLLLEFLKTQNIQRTYLPFVALQQLAETCIAKRIVLAELRDVIAAGERLKLTDEIRSLFRYHPLCRLHNHYGPTETHVVTAETLATDVDTWPAEALIGTPISNAIINIVDERMQPVPNGAVGELVIGGVSVARGYLNPARVPDDRFIESPFENNQRLYRTGDLARRNESGSLEFLGRRDDQVKLRGF